MPPPRCARGERHQGSALLHRQHAASRVRGSAACPSDHTQPVAHPITLANLTTRQQQARRLRPRPFVATHCNTAACAPSSTLARARSLSPPPPPPSPPAAAPGRRWALAVCRPLRVTTACGVGCVEHTERRARCATAAAAAKNAGCALCQRSHTTSTYGAVAYASLGADAETPLCRVAGA